MTLRPTAVLLLLSGLVAPAACSSPASKAWVELDGQRFSVEVADEHDERARGLMFRDALPTDHGMLFVHDREQPLAYWMKNTRIALDILYFDAGRRLVSIQRRVPPCSAGDRCPNYPSEGPAKYVLELSAGRSDALELEAGDEIRFSPGIPLVGQP